MTEKEKIIAAQILKEIRNRLTFMVNVGLDYLTLARSAATLSGGEAQRIRLATQIGSGLVGVLYILDEPSIGLHQRDNDRLIATLKGMRDLGNTVIVVEHDEDTIRAADWVVDIGPGAGDNGGRVMAEGTPQEIEANPASITGLYLSGKKYIPLPEHRRKGNGLFLQVLGAQEHNLKNIDKGEAGSGNTGKSGRSAGGGCRSSARAGSRTAGGHRDAAGRGGASDGVLPRARPSA